MLGAGVDVAAGQRQSCARREIFPRGGAAAPAENDVRLQRICRETGHLRELGVHKVADRWAETEVMRSDVDGERRRVVSVHSSKNLPPSFSHRSSPAGAVRQELRDGGVPVRREAN